jgi:hypothetical protein
VEQGWVLVVWKAKVQVVVLMLQLLLAKISMRFE